MEQAITSAEQFKRHTAYKYRIGAIMSGKPILDNEKLKFLEIDNKQIIRTNIIANITDKFVQEGEKKFASITLDDASGQIKAKLFGEDTLKFTNLNQGDTILVIGLLRYWNTEVYISPEIIRKKDPAFLLIRKLEIELNEPKQIDKETLNQLKYKVIEKLKEAEKDGGIEVDKIIMELKEHPSIINQEIKKILEDGLAYEPRPGKLRYLG
mgnify:CR=1 FL=1